MARRSPRRAVHQAVKRHQREIRWKPEDWFHAKQLQVFRDPSPYKLLRVGRRGGKSWFWAGCLIDEGYKYPGSRPLFVTISREDAKEILEEAFQSLDERFKIGLKENKVKGDWVMPNGSTIMLRGAGTMREINKLRGKKYPCGIVDEAQAFGKDLLYLLDQALEPAIGDYHGWIGVSGTPAVAPMGPFYEMDQGEFADTWSRYHWTVFDNPHFPKPEEFVQRVLKRRKWTHEHPGFQREYMGQWVHDIEARAFKVETERDTVAHFEPSQAADWVYVMGIDVGYVDPYAFVVLAYSLQLGQAFVIDTHEESELTTMEAMIEAERLCREYPVSRIAIDTGSGGKQVAEDWKKMSTLPIEAAKKTHKRNQISVINGDLQAGKLKICRDNNLKLLTDLMVLEWDHDRAERSGRWIYRKGFADHLADALQYGYNLCQHHSYEPVYDDRVETGSTEWYQRLEKEMEAAQLDTLEEDYGPRRDLVERLYS